jgi:hypothetical protein
VEERRQQKQISEKGGMHWFWVEVFRKRRLDFCALTKV